MKPEDGWWTMAAILAIGGGWCIGGFSMRPFTQAQHGSSGSAPLLLTDSLTVTGAPTSSVLAAPSRLTTTWLADVNARISEADTNRLDEWERAMKEWSPTARSLVEPLILARRVGLDPEASDRPWVESDIERVVDYLEGDAEPAANSGQLESSNDRLWRQLRGENPIAAFEEVDASGNLLISEDTRANVFRRLAQEDPRRAVELAERFRASHVRVAMFREITTVWAGSEPLAVMEWLEAMKPGVQRSELGQRLFDSFSYADPMQALAQVERLKAIGTSQTGHPERQLVEKWTRQDPEAALEWVEAQEQPQKYMRSVVYALSQSDPQRAAELLPGAHPNESPQLAEAIMRSWLLLSKDSAAALSWAEQLEDPQSRFAAFVAAAEDFADEDPEQAMAYVEWALEDLVDVSRYGVSNLDRLFKQLERDHPGRLDNWGVLHEVLEKSGGGLFDFVRIIGENDPERAAAMIERMPDESQGSSMSYLTREWAARDPVEAARWIAELPENEGKGKAVKSLMENWSKLDAEAAEAWAMGMESHVGGQTQDAMMAALAEARLVEGDFRSALEFLEDSHGKSAAQRWLLQRVFEGWVKTDLTVATEAFDAMNLNEESRTAIHRHAFAGLR